MRYRNALLALVGELDDAVRRHVLPVLETYEWAYRTMTADAVSGVMINSLERSTRELRREVSDRMTWLPETIADAMVTAQDEATMQALQTSIITSYQLDITPLLAGQDVEAALTLARRENVELIRSIPSQYLDRINQAVYRGVQQGLTHQEIAKKIANIKGMTRDRAKFIARDQVAKTNAAITQIRQQDLGITHYRWLTVEDERVRPTHEANHGEIFAWDDPPEETGHPGHDPNCRCSAAPILGYEGEDEGFMASVEEE